MSSVDKESRFDASPKQQAEFNQCCPNIQIHRSVIVDRLHVAA
jgi:hypothetical protein